MTETADMAPCLPSSEQIPDEAIATMAIRCGLKDPDDFALAGGTAARSPHMREAMASATGEPWAPPENIEQAMRARGTGRTTRMLLAALHAVDAGLAVEIRALDQRHANNLTASMRELGIACRVAQGRDVRIPGPEIRFVWPGQRPEATRGYLEANMRLTDHAVLEIARMTLAREFVGRGRDAAHEVAIRGRELGVLASLIGGRYNEDGSERLRVEVRPL